MITEARIATTDNITLSGAQTLQAVSLVAGDVVLVAGQTDGTTNGPYVVAAGAWSRHTDHDTAAEFVRPWEIFIREGDYANWRFQFTNLTTPTLGTSVLNFDPVQRDEVLIAGGGIEIDESANTVGLPDQPDVEGDIYVGPLRLTHLSSGIATRVAANNEQQGYIEGLIPRWNSGTLPTGGNPTFSAGAAWHPGLQKVVALSADLTTTLPPVGASDLVYFYLSGSGSINYADAHPPDDYYYGTAAAFAAPDSSRYVCTLKANAAGTAFYHFLVEALSGRRLQMTYLEDTTAAPFRVVNGGAAITNQTVDVGPNGLKLVPPTARTIWARISVNGTAAVWIDNSSMSTSPAAGSGEVNVSTVARAAYAWISLDANQQFRWANTVSGGATNIDVLKYIDRR